MRSGRSDVSWFLRAARVVPVIAGAALLGGMIGGFAMFAIDSALTWEPTSQSPQSRPEARADNAASAVNSQPTRPVRIVGGAIPDPSAGMSAPPPAPQQQHSAATPAQSQISSQLLTPKALGPASQLQPQTASTTPAQTPNATRWPDALSRVHQNAVNAGNTPSAPQQTAPAPPAQTSDRAANKNSETDRKEAIGDRAVSADNQSAADTSRHGRHSRRHTIAGTNGFGNGGDDDVSTASPSRRQAARGYDRLYDSYGNRRDQSYSRTRGQSYGDASDDQESYSSRRNRSYSNTRERSYGDAREDQNDATSRSDLSRSDTRRYGRDVRNRGKSRVINREQAEETTRTQAFEAARPRPEPFWGGGYFRRGDQDDD